jgi:hypothetical protein
LPQVEKGADKRFLAQIMRLIAVAGTVLQAQEEHSISVPVEKTLERLLVSRNRGRNKGVFG